MYRLALVLLILLDGRGVLAQAPASQPASLQTPQQFEAAFQKLIRTAAPAVVAVTRRAAADATADDQGPFANVVECGTGVIVDPAGLVLSNYHLLGDVKVSEYVIWLPGKRRLAARVKSADPFSDLAVLEVDARDLPAIKLGDAGDVQPGQMVVALGNPFAIVRDGSCSATWGMVSNRRANPAELSPDDQVESGLHQYGQLIECDASLKLATSGGPLLDLNGQMIGLVTTAAVLAGFDGNATYAIPMDAGTRRIIAQLLEGREPEYGFIGVQLDELARDDVAGPGVRVAQVVRGTPAATAGVRLNDRVTHVDGRPVSDSNDFLRTIGLRAPGDVVTLQVFRRNGLLLQQRSLPIDVTLSKKYIPRTRPGAATAPRAIWRGMIVDYATAVPDLVEKATSIDPRGCVAVIDVRRDSAAWKAGLRSGTFVTHVAGRRVASPASFYAEAEKQRADVTVQVISDTERLDLIVAP